MTVNYELIHHMKRIEDIDKGDIPQFEKSFLSSLRSDSEHIIAFIKKTGGTYQGTSWMDDAYIKELEEWRIQNDL